MARRKPLTQSVTYRWPTDLVAAVEQLARLTGRSQGRTAQALANIGREVRLGHNAEARQILNELATAEAIQNVNAARDAEIAALKKGHGKVA